MMNDASSTERTPLISETGSINAEQSSDPSPFSQNHHTAPPRHSINVMVLTVFLQSIGFTIVLPSLKFYIDFEGGDTEHLGFAVAAYSLGQLLASPVFGFWSNVRPAREGLITSLLLTIFGNIWYASAYVLPSPVWQMVVGRFVVGVGCGNVSVCRAYASHASDASNRRVTMAKMSAAQGLGFVIGPMGYLSALISVINIAVILFAFIEIPLEPPQSSKDRSPWSELLPIFISIFIFMVIIANFSVFETIVTSYTNKYYGWGVTLNGILLTAAGVIGIISFIVISLPQVKRFAPTLADDRQLLLLGLFLTTVSLLVLAQWKWFQHDVPLSQFIIGAIIQSIGYPISSAVLYAIYSRVLNPKSQGTKMGWLTAGGSLARMLGPIWASYAWKVGNDTATILFLSTAGMTSAALLVAAAGYKILKPHPLQAS